MAGRTLKQVPLAPATEQKSVMGSFAVSVVFLSNNPLMGSLHRLGKA